MYSSPATLLNGAVATVGAACVAAWVAELPEMWVAAAVLAIIAAARIVAALRLAANSEGSSTAMLELAYEVGAFSFALTLGSMAAYTIVVSSAPQVEVLMIANALGYGIGVSARNAGRPIIAIGQLAFSSLPIALAAFATLQLGYVALGLTILLLIPAQAFVCCKIFNTLRESIGSADTNQRLACKMEQLAHTDIVTGLHNRAGLDEMLIRQLNDSDSNQPLALFWLDLHRFKEVNELLGHQIGDRVLNEVARRLRDNLSHDAGIARFGGDEFVFFCKVSDRAESERLARRVLNHILRPMRLDAERMEISASMGIALMPDDGTDAERLMQAADLALYHAKFEGPGTLRFFDPAMTRDLANRREIEAELRLAIQRDELSLFYQPIVDLKTGHIRCFEALLRWFHPTKGELRPAEFIPVAEETGVIVTLGNWITRQAALACAQWPEDISVAVNLSPLQIKAPGAVLAIKQALRDANLDPHRLELEVTESLFIQDHEQTAEFIKELSAEGVRFALDDFGTGYSSLSYIHKFPFSKIKVDRCFVSGDDVGPRAHAIIRAVAAMGRGLDMEIVAEGLEEQEQVETVRDAGCTLGQGYFFSRAVPDYLAAMLLAQDRDGDGLRAA
ncbi:putative bifunctional diguanylate cyclase/phosphodiesterase [Citromicrobium bathyomarinum]|uniref:putative bifunctional diguanylate cyclase/phosphodiesterase n=1 Tax=Citromicrobium bathyomarinum TaxID=72174 RepID=UPI00315AC2DD